MKKYILVISLVVYIIILLGCNQTEKFQINNSKIEKVYTFKDFPRKDSLNFVFLTSINARLFELTNTDSCLLLTVGGEKNALKIISKNTGKILKNDLPIGNGPNEIIATFGQGVINDSLFWVYEGETMTIRFYHLFDIINNKSNADIIKKVEFDKNIFMFAFHIVPIAYDRFILTGSPLFKSKIQIINDQSEVLDTIGEFYNMNFDKLFYLKSAYLSLAEISPNHNRIINSFILEDMIEIYDIQTGKTIKVLHGPDNFRLVPEINEINKSDFFIANNDTKMASVCIFVQKQYVFLLYFGTSMIDGPSSGNQMLVIDWNGNLIKHFELSERIQDFTIDEKNHKIYAISEKGDIIYADYNIK